VVPAIVELLESGSGGHKGVSAFGKVRKEKEGEGLTKKVANLVKSIGLFGLFNVDLAMSKGKVYFIELNLRYAAYGYAITKAGVNLPSMLVRSAYSDVLEIPVSTIQRECSYINEKVALDDVAFGLRSMKDFRSLQQNADLALMNEPTEEMPYLEITRRFPMDLIKQRIKNLLHIK
jgi:predicted ATP-grasp superfamily ATP-dependent carboligase